MDTGTLVLIAVVAIIAILLGAAIGYLLGGKKDTGLEAAKSAADARSSELERQLKERAGELIKRDEEIKRLQDELRTADSARAKAETELIDERKNNAELRGEVDGKELEIIAHRSAHSQSEARCAELQARYETSLAAIEEQKKFLAEAETKLRDAFASLSSEALRKNNATFLESAKETLEAKVNESAMELETRKTAIETLVKPLGESLKKFEERSSEIELKREGAYESMTALLTAMSKTNERLEGETRNLVGALKTSHTRGRYGEIALRRLIETAGLTPYSDFFDQPSVSTDDGRLRPDCAINLPGHRQLILDSKVPLNAYFSSFETDDDDEKLQHLKRHASAVRDHFVKLSKKSYWEAFADAPDFVVMYMHIESSYGAALMIDTALIEDAFNKRVVFATPSTLLAILRTAGYMWQQEKMAAGVLEMQEAGLELYKRANKMLEHFSKVGTGLNTAVNSYNNAVGSLESRVLTQLEKIKDIGGSLARDEVQTIKPVDTSIRPLVKTIESSASNDTETGRLLDDIENPPRLTE